MREPLFMVLCYWAGAIDDDSWNCCHAWEVTFDLGWRALEMVD